MGFSGKLPTILCEIDPTDSSWKNSYVYAPDGQILCQYAGETDPDGYFYIHDRLASLRQLINTRGAVVALCTYNPFGKVIEGYSRDEGRATRHAFFSPT